VIKQYLFIIMSILTISIFFIGSSEYKVFALTDKEQRNLIGFAIGCKDGLAGKNPDPTQYDKIHGLSNHSIEYNLGYIEGYNSCSANQKIV
jgi:hypothetical protein